MSNREEKKQARAERYRQYAKNAEKASDEAYNRSSQLVAGIPAGQPIMPGRRGIAHRNTLDKSWDAMGRSVKLSEKAQYFRDKAEAAENNDSIYLDDDNAIEKLTAKVEELQKIQEFMKAVNKIVRSKLTDIQKTEQVQALGVSEQKAQKLVCIPDCFGNLAFLSPYHLKNNNANLRRYKQRLQRAITNKTATDISFICGDIEIRTNFSENRLQVFFPGKPDEEMRKSLKRSAFRWSPVNGCWQSYINRWQLVRIKEILIDKYPDREFKKIA